MRWRVEFDRDSLLFGIDLVPLSKSVPAFRNYLNQNPALWNVGNFDRTILIGLKIHFSELFFVKQPLRLVEADIDACVADRLAIRAGYFDP